jgi:hypothetical protein
MADCSVSGTVESKDFKKVHIFRADQSWSHEEPVATFRIKNGHFSGMALLDTTLVYEFVFIIPKAGMAKARSFVPTQSVVSISCPEDMFGPILLQSTTPENTNFVEYEEVGKSLKPISEPIYEKYNQLANDRTLYNDEVYALIDEANTASRERANELWSQFDKLQKLDESYSLEGLAAKHDRDSINATIDSLKRDYLKLHSSLLSSFYQVWSAVRSASQFDNDTQPWLELLRELRGLNVEPLLYADEEGGRVSRFARIPSFDIEKFESMAAVCQAAEPLASAYHCGHSFGSFLKRYGFEIDFAPVADVNTNPDNTVIGDRAFSSDPEVVAQMVRSYLEGMRQAGMMGCVKHFPGHGNALHDTHLGYSESMKTSGGKCSAARWCPSVLRLTGAAVS